MLLRHICRAEAAEKLEKALDSCDLVVDVNGVTGAEYADAVVKALSY